MRALEAFMAWRSGIATRRRGIACLVWRRSGFAFPKLVADGRAFSFFGNISKNGLQRLRHLQCRLD